MDKQLIDWLARYGLLEQQPDWVGYVCSDCLGPLWTPDANPDEMKLRYEAMRHNHRLKG